MFRVSRVRLQVLGGGGGSTGQLKEVFNVKLRGFVQKACTEDLCLNLNVHVTCTYQDLQVVLLVCSFGDSGLMRSSW